MIQRREEGHNTATLGPRGPADLGSLGDGTFGTVIDVWGQASSHTGVSLMGFKDSEWEQHMAHILANRP